MVGKLLMRGMLAGIVAGLLTFAFARVAGEPLVDTAISLEEKMHAAHDHGDAHEEALVSRGTQAGLGLLTGIVAYGMAFGGLFALTFAYLYGRVGRIGARALSAWLALGAFVAVVLVPTIKYPANPPSVGDPDTIGMRTGLFFLMIVTSIVVMVFAMKVRKHLLTRLGQWNASIAGGIAFVAIIAAIEIALPTVNEVPEAFPAVVLWKFRMTALGMQALMWATIGLLFGAMVERSERIARASGTAARKSAYQ
ncbi:CbtA family protein [Paraburkholderia diazotrophica]|uniref:Probable cobalt transporter subunit (CbtA) n=1 Tax=Paraburkholderia diazotrophica TaxID=667676 RepID=A0A1H6VJW7_9BURK|nr:CbtA family protein [Paraburkholderia diazotrophica]SEJ04873.1 Probable cobalt transporter subunit (CbtA) [Paraburkholderia diazotrophica]